LRPYQGQASLWGLAPLHAQDPGRRFALPGAFECQPFGLWRKTPADSFATYSRVARNDSYIQIAASEMWVTTSPEGPGIRSPKEQSPNGVTEASSPSQESGKANVLHESRLPYSVTRQARYRIRPRVYSIGSVTPSGLWNNKTRLPGPSGPGYYRNGPSAL